MKYVVLGVAVAAVAQAQNSTLIPANISSTCSTFLNSINIDNDLSNCVQPLLNATASFSPSSTANLTEDDINETLGSICKGNAGCSDSTIRTWLSNFYSNCQPELTGTSTYNAQVRELYDVLYVVNPLKSAVCSINSANQDYCVKDIQSSEKSSSSSKASSNSSSTSGSASASASASGVANNNYLASISSMTGPVEFAAANLYIKLTAAANTVTKRAKSVLASRAADSQVNLAIITPNATTYRSTNLPFLFLQPDMSSAQLCTPCTREVFVSYIKWESQSPYALGLSQSEILGGQSKLWQAVNATCGAAYVQGVISEVGSSNFQSSGIGAAFATTSQIPGLALGFAVIAGASSLLF